MRASSVFVLLALSVAAVPAATPEGSGKAREKRQLIAEELQLTESESEKFWPVYQELQRRWDVQRAKRAASLREFGSQYERMSEAEAKKLTYAQLEFEEDRVRLFRSYLPRFKKSLSWRKIARYYQIENRLYAEVNAELAHELPLIK